MIFLIFFFFFFNDTATTEIYTLSLHDALPISYIASLLGIRSVVAAINKMDLVGYREDVFIRLQRDFRSEEHTSELQSQSNLVCRLLLEKKKKKNKIHYTYYNQTTKRIQ